jgi:hypothetical protein
MKKIIYIAIVALLISLTIISCTEENVKPSPSIGNQGGSGSGDPIKD